MGASKSSLKYSEWVTEFGLLPSVDFAVTRDDALALWLEFVRSSEDKDAEQLADLSLDPDLDLDDEPKKGHKRKPSKGGGDATGHRRTATASSQMMAALRESQLNLRLDAELSTTDGKFHPLYNKLMERYSRQVVEQNENKITEFLQKRSAEKKSKAPIETSQTKYKKYFSEAVQALLKDSTSEAQFLRACRSSRNIVRKVEFIEVAFAGGTLKADGVKWRLFNVYRDPLPDEPPSGPERGDSDESDEKISLMRKTSGDIIESMSVIGKPGNVKRSSQMHLSPTMEPSQPRMPGLVRLNSTSRTKKSEEKGTFDEKEEKSSTPKTTPKHSARGGSNQQGMANLSLGGQSTDFGGKSTAIGATE